MLKIKNLMAIGLAAVLSMSTGQALAQKTYNVASLGDYSGPFASIYPPVEDARRAVIEWWNKEVGAKSQVTLKMKTYDTRYDVAQTASLWPGIKSELQPIAILGLGGSDFAALQTRLPDDKIPLTAANGAYGFAWKADPWAFLSRPTYAHETGAFVNWMSERLNRPVKFVTVSSEASAGFADMAKGIQTYARENPTKAQLIETVFTDLQPSDLTLQMRRVTAANPDVIVVLGTMGQVIATKRALQTLGKKIPVLVSSHNGLATLGPVLGGMAAVEGDYEAHATALATAEASDAHAFYEMLQKNYGLKAAWNGFTIMGLAQTVYTVRAIERAQQKAGNAAITGADVRAALLAGPFRSSDLFGLAPDLEFTSQAPFPTTSAKVNIGTVKDGKFVSVAQGVPVPTVSKW
ncbi:ABC transporter substrate-binding protein [Simplicispira suum]|uniref:ABC transporter substrate-binding protein n=1 Tax=Simplicispira suum TaxID=2109915 RepID=A0A2S0N2M2_9BURK|nr:ABC transporter substrate-binding protein [Simplicispira suum]AVO42392.1 ABC transporter substrate-binding protein [Simplicispira suum]